MVVEGDFWVCTQKHCGMRVKRVVMKTEGVDPEANDPDGPPDGVKGEEQIAVHLVQSFEMGR